MACAVISRCMSMPQADNATGVMTTSRSPARAAASVRMGGVLENEFIRRSLGEGGRIDMLAS